MRISCLSPKLRLASNANYDALCVKLNWKRFRHYLQEVKMAFEQLKVAITMLMDEITQKPEDAHVLQEQLREKISELKTMGLPVPADI
jgi:hypothetical protein